MSEYRTATAELTRCITLDDLAAALGASIQSVKQARMDPGSDGYRNPPPGWKEAVQRLAQDRATELYQLAQSLAADTLDT